MRTFLRRVTVTATAIAALTAVSAPAAFAVGVTDAVKLTNHDPGGRVDDADVLAALRRIGASGGSTVDQADLDRLIYWARKIDTATTVAESKVGVPYRWGATGPNAFDCSGLTLFSYRAAGVSLPRTSRAQYSATTSVSFRDLRPGDLLFFGSPVHHVAMYVGDGRSVEASRAGVPVRVNDGLLLRRDLVKVGRVTG